jgi:hypothetical protein
MRLFSRLPATALAFATALAGGCAFRHPVQQSVGLIPPAERSADLRDDRIRLMGVDRAPAVPPSEPIYEVPGFVFEAVFDFLFVSPAERLYAHFTGDTAGRAARDMLDTQSADNRRYGILRLAGESFARQSPDDRLLWADMARHDPDYTVRAAAIRALNWSRAPGNGPLYIDSLGDEQVLVRLEAAKALANAPDDRAAAPLLDHLQQDASRDVRVASADALRCYHTQEVAHALILLLNDPDFAVCWQARQSLRLMTAHDFHYDEQAWLGYLSGNRAPFG